MSSRADISNLGRANSWAEHVARTLPGTHGRSCGLLALLENASSELSPDTVHRLHELLEAGWTLRRSVPHVVSQLQSEWLGERWLLVHQSHYNNSLAWTSIISSRLTCDEPLAQHWPQLLERALRNLARDEQTCLWTKGTTLAPMLAALLPSCQVHSLNIQLPTEVKQQVGLLANWLWQVLTEVALAEPLPLRLNPIRDRMFLSPGMGDAYETKQGAPIRDLVSVLYAQKLYALTIRESGTLAQLLIRRLQDRRFPAGTVALRVRGASNLRHKSWSDHRAVGWYVPLRAANALTSSVRRSACSHDTQRDAPQSLYQWQSNLHLLRSPADYLVHCVRGQQGHRRMLSSRETILDAIYHGSVVNVTAFQALLNIVHSRRLRAGSKLLRSQQAAISFSAVPLDELLTRRRFQSHLGRWDWEPYGVMIRRGVLEDLGARPVIYGTEPVYAQLGDNDRLYFQPEQRRSAKTELDHWQAEREWRLAGDLRLIDLPSQSLLLFVQYERQAQALSRTVPWPIIWLQSGSPVETQRLPSSRAPRQRKLAQTSRN